jgi:hypothetical protein
MAASQATQPRELPGFYFDPERQRYFLIVPNHHAPPSITSTRRESDSAYAPAQNPTTESHSKGSRYRKHTKQYVTLQHQYENEAHSKRRRLDTILSQTVHRSSFLTHQLTGLDLRLRLGSTARIGDAVRRQYVSLLEPTRILSNPPESMARLEPAGSFCIHEGSQTLFIYATSTTHSGALSTQRELCAIPIEHIEKTTAEEGNLQQERVCRYESQRSQPIPCPRNPSCIVPVTQSSVMWSLSLLENGSEYSKLYWAMDFRQTPNNDWRMMEFQFAQTIRDLAIPPSSLGKRSAGATPDRVLVVSDSRLVILGLNPSNITLDSAWNDKDLGDLTITKGRFRDQNVFMAGTRQGNVVFADCRVKPIVDRLMHRGPIAKMWKMRNENMVLVAGMERISIYDLRYSKDNVMRKRNGKLPRTQSVLDLVIPSGMKQKTWHFESEYDDELNLLAVTHSDLATKHRVGIWDCGTGKPIEVGELVNRQFSHQVTGLQMVDLRGNGPGAKSILTVSDGILEEWHV